MKKFVGLLVIGCVLSVSATEVQAQQRTIECIRQFRDFYYSREGGDLSSSDALAKAEQTCAERSERRERGRTDNPDRPFGRNPSGTPEAIASCMKKLMYERKLVCTRTGFPGCSNFPSEGFGGWQTQEVRTDMSERTAVRACQNAR